MFVRKLKRKRPKRRKDHLLLKICVAAALCHLLSIWLKSHYGLAFALCLWFCVFFTVILDIIRNLTGRKGILRGFRDLVALFVAICLAVILIQLIEYPLGSRLWCRINLNSLGRAISLYADEHNDTYPAYDKWCDLLIEHGNISKSVLKCRSVRKRGLCDYAMNPNADPSGASDMVLLFESKSGWNQYGGEELLKLGKHVDKGCSILFNDGHIEFVRQIDLAKLKWKDKQEQ